ncbi:MAG: phage integrase family protein, partial [Thiobacillus sp.]|nr:phage integrase family protein [Thiobacillus sp.]
GRHALARLLRLPLGTLPEAVRSTTALPSLETFREAHDPDHFYSEKELTAMYVEAYPQSIDRRARRYARLVERQLAALVWVEELLATDPQPQDPVAAWFEDRLAARLILAGIPTIEALHQRVRTQGYRWWVSVPRLGEKGARRLVTWLATHEGSLGVMAPQSLAPLRSLSPIELTRPSATAIMPLESFSTPAELDGSVGENRCLGRSRIAAENDHQAIQAWLKARASNPHTERAYRREAERLLIWSIMERGRALSSLSIEDAVAYRDWLGGLGRTLPAAWPWRLPQAEWMGKRSTPRWSANWRPFEGAASLRSQIQAHTILKSLFEWLAKVRYLDSNPWDGVPPPQRVMDVATAPDLELTHAFTRNQWAFLMEYLHRQPMDESVRRLRFILPFAYATGLRLTELVDARLGRLYSVPLKRDLGVRWMLKVLGKGGKWRAVPMPGMVMDALREYLAWRGLNADPLDNPGDVPMITRLRLGQDTGTLDPTTLYKALKAFFREAAAELATQGHHDDAKKMAKASTHWLRHARGAHSAETMPVNMIQRLLGHASVATTSIYTSTDDEVLFLLLDDSLKIETQPGIRAS